MSKNDHQQLAELLILTDLTAIKSKIDKVILPAASHLHLDEGLLNVLRNFSQKIAAHLQKETS